MLHRLEPKWALRFALGKPLGEVLGKPFAFARGKEEYPHTPVVF